MRNISLKVVFVLIVIIALFTLREIPRRRSTNIATPAPDSRERPESKIHMPIDRALERITKKSFGTKVSPGDSPVLPERFSGYHTGVDFETFPEEENSDVPIYAICTGRLREKKWASGYGGLLVEACTIDGNSVTVIYGHLKLGSISAKTDTVLHAGDKIGILGKGRSQETDGERKHLHLGIHKGTSLDIRGYVQNQSELRDWLDPEKYLH